MFFASERTGYLHISDVLAARITAEIDALDEFRGVGIRVGVTGYPDDSQTAVNAVRTLRPPNAKDGLSVFIYIGPPMGQPPTPPPPSKMFLSLASAFETAVTCGTAIIAWIAVWTSVATAAETGGVSLLATRFLYAGAAAATVQCAGHLEQSWLTVEGHPELAEAMRRDVTWRGINGAADIVNLINVGFALRDVTLLVRALRRCGVRVDSAAFGMVADDEAVSLSEILSLLKTSANAQAVAKTTKDRLIGGVGAAFGLGGSATDENGVIRTLARGTKIEDVARPEIPGAPTANLPGLSSSPARTQLASNLDYRTGQTLIISTLMHRTKGGG